MIYFFINRELKDKDSNIAFGSPFDVRGRGFALPRMWAQYANNNCGVCLIVRKQPLEEKVRATYPEAICRGIKYFDLSGCFEISIDCFESFFNVINANPRTGFAATYLKNDPIFTEYAYFSKYKDWEGEKEYRILVPNRNDDTEYLHIDGVKSFLAGIVIGEYMEAPMVKAIRAAIPNSIPMRRIIFRPSHCTIENINDIIKE